MRKFKGQINGVEYTDMEEFEAAYKLVQSLASPSDPINVSYSIECVEDDSTDKKPQTEKTRTRGNAIESLTEEDGKILCDSVEKIRDIVNDTTSRIQPYIDANNQTYRNMREFGVMTDAAITKIRWIVQSLPLKLRRELCTNIYDATKEMVDNINSELVDTRYEMSKRQEIISEEVSEIEKDIKEIDLEIDELQKEKSELYDEISERQQEYDQNTNKIQTISIASKFFDDLIESFDI